MIKVASPILFMILAAITLFESDRAKDKEEYRLTKIEACMWIVDAMLTYIAFCK